MNKWANLADKKIVEKTIANLKINGIEVYFVANKEEAKKKAIELLPEKADVMNMTSMTLEAVGMDREVNESARYNSIRNKLNKMDRKVQGKEMQQLGAAPEWAIGSIHAVTQEGQIMVASMSGSQLPAYAYGASHVIWVVGTQKIVRNIDEGMKRLYEYTLHLESERAKKAYGVPGSAVNKLLILNKEIQEGRIHLIFVNEVLGF